MKIETDYGTEIVTEDALIDALDKIEAELATCRRAHDALASPDHCNVRRLLEKLGRRNRTAHIL